MAKRYSKTAAVAALLLAGTTFTYADDTAAAPALGWHLPGNHVVPITTDPPLSGGHLTVTASSLAGDASAPSSSSAFAGIPAGATCGPWTLPRAVPTAIPCPFSLTDGPEAGERPPWLTSRPNGLPPEFWTGTLTAGAVCGTYTLPVDLPFSPPCPFSSSSSSSSSSISSSRGYRNDTTRASGAVPPTPKATRTTSVQHGIPSTTIYGHSGGSRGSATQSSSPPPSPTSSRASPSRSRPTSTVATTTTPHRATTATTIRRPSTTTTITTRKASSTPTTSSAVTVVTTLTLVPDPPYTPDAQPSAAHGASAVTTLRTMRRRTA
ncbi:hypothetical protein SPI_00481 [Niveomyces insectorum RCEF 264]|uniref:Uncharacterized protein n=1 Tax=Niveomyces insectorum RCEF 264 TaxID=1081102 RepID=A0A168A5V0_9HYPO|nr:hypothetical protein SPI_00481 [Niveomyces insectorum RCEF 264]